MALGWDLLDETVAELNLADDDARPTWSLRVERAIDTMDRLLSRAETRNPDAPASSGTDAFDALVADLDD